VNLTIRTNNAPRDLLCWHDLTTRERAEFDYIDDPESCGNQFFRYRGCVYDSSEFMSVSNMPFRGKWDGYHSDSYFSGILIRLVDDCERVICGTYFS
jgi:hypothetical protein